MTEKWKQEKLKPYIARISSQLFDISTENTDYVKKQESFFRAKMLLVEWEFLEDQRSERKMYCTSFVDKRWAAGVERREKQGLALANMKTNEEERMKLAETKVTVDEEDNELKMQEDVDYDVEESNLKMKERAFGEVVTKKVVRYG